MLSMTKRQVRNALLMLGCLTAALEDDRLFITPRRDYRQVSRNPSVAQVALLQLLTKYVPNQENPASIRQKKPQTKPSNKKILGKPKSKSAMKKQKSRRITVWSHFEKDVWPFKRSLKSILKENRLHEKACKHLISACQCACSQPPLCPSKFLNC